MVARRRRKGLCSNPHHQGRVAYQLPLLLSFPSTSPRASYNAFVVASALRIGLQRNDTNTDGLRLPARAPRFFRIRRQL